VKGRLLWRSLVRGRGRQLAAALIGLSLFLAPIWVGLVRAAGAAVRDHGADGAVAALATLHLGWLTSAFLFSAFAEGLELRALLRYPVRPSIVFVLNAVLAPVDLVALFLIPPLLGVVLASARQAGIVAGLGVALASLLTVLMTGVVLHILLAALGRWLRQEWSRAVAGLLFGVAFAVPAVVVHRNASSASLRAVSEAALATIPATARLAARIPTTAFPTLVARAAFSHSAGAFLVGLLGTLLLLAAGVAVGTRWSVSAALAGEAAGGRKRGRGTGSALFERVLGRELGLLLSRELRYWLRTPQVLVGLFTTPLLVLFFFYQPGLPRSLRFLFLPLLCLVSVFNLSANQFGLDREGVRLLFLLPIPPARLMAAKNLAAFVMAGTGTALSLILVRVLRGVPARELFGPALSVVATLPAVLIAGNELSTRHPWRMTFKVGGTPPGAMASAMVQLGVVAIMAVLLAVPVVAGRLLGAPTLALLGTALVGVVAWTAWAFSLAPAARRLTRRQERLLDVLAHPHETG
jgi:predicted permease